MKFLDEGSTRLLLLLLGNNSLDFLILFIVVNFFLTLFEYASIVILDYDALFL
jgi:hypothetical protein